ncbi:LamG-like jellyroll fold domain-containing protein [Rosettibacter firmus]|uniref:LamG-like jellyroll fold domain-containing protein n=1 Tax=Rosettibacter firmus TaxID=3111522 RepID=UPI00336BCD34
MIKRNNIGLLLIFFTINIYSQQISIERIEKMPNIPSPYHMRNWKQVARGYDSLIYNINAKGEYLPLVFLNYNTLNYPDHVSFGLHSYVGTNYPSNSEAINVLPSLVGSTLVGINKRNQFGYDWIKMSREYFNKRPEMNVYKNSPYDNSYDDWWYETIPNLFFYQLYSLYPDIEDYDYQFKTIAERFLEVVKLSGGNVTPWKIPDFNYRGWDFINKKPYQVGVAEPETAGAIAYILYNAYLVTQEKKYLIGAELSLEYLNSLIVNPAYEIQLPYGVYTAARMNAEIGTDYDLEKMFKWCFSYTNLRRWNVLTGKWGVYDINGLIGEDSERQYAFSMNTFQQIAALVPVARYDERFARAIGKWILNAANSLRLFYSKFLDDIRQDSENWSHLYDPDSYIAYESLLKLDSGWPLATGDAIKGGWAKTNLSLYSSSSVGYLAAIVDTTDIPKILKLDLNKTDFFQKKAYPTFLLFNPYDEAKTVKIDLPDGVFDIYETTSNTFINYGVSNYAEILIPSNNALVIVLAPYNGEKKYELNKLLINDIVVDYNVNQSVENYPPRIKSLAAVSEEILKNTSTKIYCTAVDKNESVLNYYWYVNEGSIKGEGSVIDYFAPDKATQDTIKVIVVDSKGEKDSSKLILNVVDYLNRSPKINSIKATPRKIKPATTTRLFCFAEDEDDDSLIYYWSSDVGSIEPDLNYALWTAPNYEGDFYIKCIVSDIRGNITEDSLKIMVRNFSDYSSANLVLYLPFNNNVNDESGNANSVINYGATFVEDKYGVKSSALYFDGFNDYVLIKNNTLLNFQDAIGISFWIKQDGISNKEMYIISHGSWDKRYKISIANKKLRWTIKTDKLSNNIFDLDSESEIKPNEFIFCVVNYNGQDVELWINGELDSFAQWTGKLQTTNIDLTIAQMLPDNSNYNFKGVIDDIRIYNNALMPGDIKNLYSINSYLKDELNYSDLQSLDISNFPNPFNSTTSIVYKISNPAKVLIEVYNVLGQKINTLVDKEQSSGLYEITWNGKNNYGIDVPSGIYFCVIKTKQEMKMRKLILIK